MAVWQHYVHHRRWFDENFNTFDKKKIMEVLNLFLCKLFLSIRTDPLSVIQSVLDYICLVELQQTAGVHRVLPVCRAKRQLSLF